MRIPDPEIKEKAISSIEKALECGLNPITGRSTFLLRGVRWFQKKDTDLLSFPCYRDMNSPAMTGLANNPIDHFKTGGRYIHFFCHCYFIVVTKYKYLRGK